MNDYLFQHRV